jgi:hypothetical protein
MMELSYLGRVLPTMVLGILAAHLAIEYGLGRLLNRLLRPLVVFSHLPGEIGLGAAVRALSPSAGYSVLAGYHGQGVLGEREVILTLLLATLPYHLHKLFSFYLPVLVPLLGVPLAFKLIAIKLGAASLQSLAALLYGRLRYPAAPSSSVEEGREEGGDPRRAFRGGIRTLKRVLPTFLIAYFAAQLLVSTGTLEPLTEWAAPLAPRIGLPEASTAVIAAQLVNMPAGYTVASAFLEEEVLTEEAALLTLVLGLLFGTPRVFLQYSLPLTVSLFRPRMGSKIVAVKILAEILSIGVFLPFLL